MAAEDGKQKGKKGGHLRGWIESVLEAAGIVLVVFLLCWPVRIQGPSMEGALCSGDRVCISRVLVFAGQLRRGDIVMCKIEENGHTENIIKRVIGLPGDVIVVQDGAVLVNGEALFEAYVNGAATAGDVSLTLGKGMYFVMGDNREVSIDSRVVGPIPKSDIIGKAILQFYPLNKARLY